MSLERLEPDKAAYQEELASFIRTTVANYPRTDVTTKIKLTSQANRQYTRQYGVEINLLMTKLFGAQRIQFGYDNDPDLKHYALKIYGKVYEFGPYPEKVRKTLFLDWCAENLAFEFATKSSSANATTEGSQINGNNNNDENRMPGRRQPVTTFTMKFEHEMDAWVKEFCETAEPHHPTKNNCLKFVESALGFLDPSPNPDTEIHVWLKYNQRRLSSTNSNSPPAVQLPQIESTTSNSTTPSESPIAMDITTIGAEPVDDEEIELVDLASEDESYELCEL